MIFPEHDGTNRALGRGSISRKSIGRISVDHGTALSSPVSPVHPRGNHRRRRIEAWRHSASILQFVRAGDAVGLEQFLSILSPSERELVFAVETALASNCNPVLVAVKLGNLAVVRSVLEWLSEEQVCEMWFCTEAEAEDVLTNREKGLGTF